MFVVFFPWSLSQFWIMENTIMAGKMNSHSPKASTGALANCFTVGLNLTICCLVYYCISGPEPSQVHLWNRWALSFFVKKLQLSEKYIFMPFSPNYLIATDRHFKLVCGGASRHPAVVAGVMPLSVLWYPSSWLL